MTTQTFDKCGRMRYNPDIHFNHRKDMTLSELRYLADYYAQDGAKNISLALGRTESTITKMVCQLRKDGVMPKRIRKGCNTKKSLIK